MPNAVLGTLAATIVGTLVLRRVTAYPGVWSLSLVLPTFALTFIVTAMLFFLVRIDYSRFQFIASSVLVTGWFFFVAIIEHRVRRPRFLLLPFGNGRHLDDHRQVDWVVAQSGLQLNLPLDGRGQAPEPNRLDLLSLSKPPPGIEAVVADLRADLPDQWQEFLARCALSGVPVYHSKQIVESLTGRVEIEHLSENSFGSLLPSSVYIRLKRAIDVAAILLLAPAAALIGVVAAIAIKLDDGGPIFFHQPRIGYRGKVFDILKFRTMRHDAQSGALFTRPDDERITRVGRFLRRYRIDELPQIVNILRGEMSWIGPRPEALLLSQWYQSKIPFYAYRHILRPGITGWAQVNQGNVAEIAAATGKLHYDFFYIKNFSPWLDLVICLHTMRIILTGFGTR
jgi:lipopolysaccharide/colanic/teichoic acid biosynthesis glycosyltransferase